MPERVLFEGEIPWQHFDWGSTNTGGTRNTGSWRFGHVRPGPPEDPTAGALAVLGVPPGAPPDVMRRAYRARLKETHPDHGGTAEAVRKVIAAGQALGL